MRRTIESAVPPETILRLGSAPADGKPVDATGLQSLTASMPQQKQTADDLVRSMRDNDRF